MEKYTHIKINLGKQCFITHKTSIDEVKERIELLKEISKNPIIYDRVLTAIGNGDYEYINMDKKTGKRKRLAKEKNLQS